MLNVKNTIVDTLLSIVAPHLCSSCGQIGAAFCDNCKYDIINESFSTCILCSKISEIGVCEEHKILFNQAFVVGERSGALQRLIGGYKFQNMKAGSVDLADLLFKRLPVLPPGSVFVPIPTTRTHIRERGYDHMLLIAEELAKRCHLPIQTILVRGNQLTQHHVGRKERLLQARTAFRLKGYIDESATYILLDDVVTTGATIVQAARLLREAGATNVWVAVTSRQPLD